MGDFVLIDGDQALFVPAFGSATVVVQPGRLTGSGPLKVSGKRACVSGDEGSVSVPGCAYAAPPYVIPGTGALAISALAEDQLAPTSKTGGVELMVKGSQFTAKFSVESPAMQPPPGPGSPIPDSMTEYSGSGSFQTTNTEMKAG
jgi:hypothetical protein